MANKEFPDLPAGSPITMEHLLFYLKRGREIEFVYKDKKYFISNEKRGRIIWSGNAQLSEPLKDDQINGLLNAVLDDKRIRDIFASLEGHIQTVF